MILGILSSVGVAVSLYGGLRLYRFTPYIGGENGYASVSAMHEMSDLKREHYKAWGILLTGFALQFIGSLGWLFELFARG